MYACSGVLYNHESPLRPSSSSPARSPRRSLRFGRAGKIVLGNLDVRRDWGAAADYVDAMWRMLQQDDGRPTT